MGKSLKDLTELGIESLAAETGCTDCDGCPALEWAERHEGVYLCTLGFEVAEKDGTARPQNGCIRPKTIGASYLIAKALGRPEPMVGKPDKDAYDRYIAQRNNRK